MFGAVMGEDAPQPVIRMSSIRFTDGCLDPNSMRSLSVWMSATASASMAPQLR